MTLTTHSTTWSAYPSSSSCRSGSSVIPLPPTPPTHWCVLLFTSASITGTVCWPCARSTWLTSFNRFCTPQLGLYYNVHIGHPLSVIRYWPHAPTATLAWHSKCKSASTGWLPDTSLTIGSRCQFCPLAPPCIQPGFRSIFSLSLERERRQLALVASSMLRPPFGTRSLMICAILNSPLAALGTNWKLSFSPKFNASHFLIFVVVRLLWFYFLCNFINSLPCAQMWYFISWRVQYVMIDWLIDWLIKPQPPKIKNCFYNNIQIPRLIHDITVLKKEISKL